jgi:copper chaperone CopZ
VRHADVSFRTKEAVVLFDPAQVTVDQMLAAIQQAGFQPSVKQAPER